MADFADLGSQSEQLFLETALANRRASRITDTTGFDGVHCLDCEDVIPAARRAFSPGITRCITCQQDYELLKKRGNGALQIMSNGLS